MSKQEYVTRIMEEWYLVMAKNNVSVQPKTSTLLGMVLANYDIKPKYESRNLWDEFLSMPGGQCASWYDSLSEIHKKEFDVQRQSKSSSRNKSVDFKALLKG